MLEDAYAAWDATQPTTLPMDPTPGPNSCGGFCDWKAWCPHWWTWRQESGTLHKGDFCDAVVLLHRYEPTSGAAVLELCEPLDSSGAPYRPATSFPPDLTVEERRLSRRCKGKGTRDRSSSARS